MAGLIAKTSNLARDDKMSHSSFATPSDNLKNRHRTIFGDYWHKENSQKERSCASTNLHNFNTHPYYNCNHTINQGNNEVSTSNKCSNSSYNVIKNNKGILMKSEIVSSSYNKTYNKIKPSNHQPMKIQTLFDKTEVRRSVRFDPRICVTEFITHKQESYDDDDQDSTFKQSDNSGWFTKEEIQMFRIEAAYLYEHIQKLSRSISSDEVQDSRRLNNDGDLSPRKSFFSNSALKVSNGDHVLLEGTEMLSQSLANHIRKILVVEPNASYQEQICQGFAIMFPDASIVGVNNADEALKAISTTGSHFSTSGSDYNLDMFDIIVIDERLNQTKSPRVDLSANRPSSPVAVVHSHEEFGKHHEYISSHEHTLKSGSNLMQKIKSFYKSQSKIQKNSSPCANFARDNFGWRETLFIGVSSFLSEDTHKLTRGGSDFLWGNPLPRIDRSLRNTIFTLLLEKRGFSSVIC